MKPKNIIPTDRKLPLPMIIPPNKLPPEKIPSSNPTRHSRRHHSKIFLKPIQSKTNVKSLDLYHTSFLQTN